MKQAVTSFFSSFSNSLLSRSMSLPVFFSCLSTPRICSIATKVLVIESEIYNLNIKHGHLCMALPFIVGFFPKKSILITEFLIVLRDNKEKSYYFLMRCKPLLIRPTYKDNKCVCLLIGKYL